MKEILTPPSSVLPTNQIMNILVALFGTLVVATVSYAQCTGNDHPSCSSWKANGYCKGTSTIEQKKRYCGVACGLCNTDGSQTGTGGGTKTSPCTDANANCKAWAATGFCTSTLNSNAMKLQYCCNTCRPVVFGTTAPTTAKVTGSPTAATGTPAPTEAPTPSPTPAPAPGGDP